jgi:hypothetical protein
MLGTEFASNALGALLAAIILSRVRGSRFTKSLLAAGMGALAWLSIDASYWNWYGFPNAFAGAAFIEQTVGWFLSGGAISLVLGRERPSPSDPFAMTA